MFANSRRLAETLTSRINELAVERGGDPIAKAHHGSVSREQRAIAEEELKAGALPAVVATSSLELGIDMGAVDLVVQVEAPPSVASGLQRIGRAGHQVGATSRGVFFPKFRGDVIGCAVISERMLSGAIEELAILRSPLDVLAQQVVAAVAMDEWTVDDLEQLLRRAAPFSGLTRPVLESVLDMLSGRYPSEEFAELRPRLTWDRNTQTLIGRRGAQRVAVTSGGTIPDRGLFGVFVPGDGPGRRVGELDEEMVYESRVGDVITLGTSTWRITEITHDQVLVAPAPGQPGKLPFWHGDTIGRPAELGRAVGEFVREVGALSPKAARQRLTTLDDLAADNLIAHLTEQREATGLLPDDRTVVVERFRDELGDWRIVIHSPWGAPVHAPWSLAIAARLRDRYGVDVSAMYADDGIVLRLPDMGEWEESQAPDIGEHIVFDPDEIAELVTEQVGGSALFAARFRECAGRALLLPQRRPGQRQALWQQRQRAGQLLEVAARYPDFPIVLEAVRECLQDVFDLPGLTDLMRRIGAREVTTVEVTTSRPSPFATSLVFGYVAQFLYEGDAPLAEKRAAALSLDPDLLAEVLGATASMSLRDLLDADALARTEAELQHLVPQRFARDPDEITDLLRVLGPLHTTELAARCREPDQLDQWLTDLVTAGRIFAAHDAPDDATGPLWAAIEDAGRLRDGLGVALPVGVPEVFAASVDDPIGELIGRYARTHGPFTQFAVAQRLRLGVAVVQDRLQRLVADGRLATGEFLPQGSGLEYCDPGVLRTIRRRSVAALRAEVEPVPTEQFAGFLPHWQGLTSPDTGVDAVLAAVGQLAGVPLPASALESLILPARVRDYRPGMLDELTTAGEVIWRGHGALAGNDGWVSLYPAQLAGALSAPAAASVVGAGVGGNDATGVTGENGADDDATWQRLLDLLADGGGYFFAQLRDAAGAEAANLLWQLVWDGRVTNDTLAPIRRRLVSGGTTHKVRAPAGRAHRRTHLRMPVADPGMPGRWSLVPQPTDTITAEQRAVLTADLLLDRYGIVTRGSVQAEQIPGGFAGVYHVLSAAEAAGKVRRGYFVEGLGAAQFADAGAVDAVRAVRSSEQVLVLAATDPANPFGAALPWPAVAGHRPARKAGSMVVLAGGVIIGYLERGGRTLLTWPSEAVSAAAERIAELVHSGRVDGLTIEKVDGNAVHTDEHPWVVALLAAGFHRTPRGIRLRR